MKSGGNGEKENLRSMFNSYKVKLSLNFKLFLGMGVFWICDISQRYIQTNLLFTTILDTITCSQGILIFVLFIAKKRIVKQLVDMYNKKILGLNPMRSSASRSTTMTVFTVNSTGGTEMDSKYKK
ncbi:hypothetical protein WDU94_008504 [Cyamophila willieti]